MTSDVSRGPVPCGIDPTYPVLNQVLMCYSSSCVSKTRGVYLGLSATHRGKIQALFSRRHGVPIQYHPPPGRKSVTGFPRFIRAPAEV